MEKGPQFKVFHGDQGTLFNQQEHAAIQAQRVVGDERYPRGYTPERMREVKSALGFNGYQKTYNNVRSPNRADVPEHRVSAFLGHTGKDPNRRPWMGRVEGEAKVAETIARSTMPIAWKDYKAAPHIVIGGNPRTEDERDATGGRSGYYRAQDRTAQVGAVDHYNHDPGSDDPEAGNYRVSSSHARQLREDQDQTLIHELGHHHSHITGTEHSAYTRASERGREEAFADDFKDKHYRQDPRDVRRKKGNFDPRTVHAYNAMGREPRDPYAKHSTDQGVFADNYKLARKENVQGQQVPKAEDSWAAEREHGTGRLFETEKLYDFASETAYGGRGHKLRYRIDPKVDPNMGRQFSG